MRPLPMVPMTSLPPFQARLLAARLGAEGILWQLRGETAIYPFAPVEVLVEAGEVEHARALLDPAWAQDDDTGPAVASPTLGPQPASHHSRRTQVVVTWLVIGVVLLALALRITHLG